MAVLLLLACVGCARTDTPAGSGSPAQPGPQPSVGWFTTGQRADLMVSGAGFNNTGGPLQFNHPSGIASDGERFLLCDRFNNRVLVWASPPDRWDAPPALVLGQPDFTSNDPGTTKSSLNWPGNVSTARGVVAVADTDNDRILVWRRPPASNAQAADVAIDLRRLTRSGASQP